MRVILLSFWMFFNLSLCAQADENLSLNHFNLGEANLAMNGYDPVAYFTEHKALEGLKEYSFIYQGILYYFWTDQNRDLFKSSPSDYQPEYGGWCAYQMGRAGEKVSVNQQTFELKGGRLYLFYDQFFVNTKTKWLKDREALSQKADAEWQEWQKGNKKE